MTESLPTFFASVSVSLEECRFYFVILIPARVTATQPDCVAISLNLFLFIVLFHSFSFILHCSTAGMPFITRVLIGAFAPT